eukprot:c18773_g1_i1 orf=542-1222(-)
MASPQIDVCTAQEQHHTHSRRMDCYLICLRVYFVFSCINQEFYPAEKAKCLSCTFRTPMFLKMLYVLWVVENTTCLQSLGGGIYNGLLHSYNESVSLWEGGIITVLKNICILIIILMMCLVPKTYSYYSNDHMKLDPSNSQHQLLLPQLLQQQMTQGALTNLKDRFLPCHDVGAYALNGICAQFLALFSTIHRCSQDSMCLGRTVCVSLLRLSTMPAFQKVWAFCV